MESTRIAELLQPFTGGIEPPAELLQQLQLYLDLLLRWNAKMNLTAVRDPEQIVVRHFGESLFAARTLLRDAGEGQPATTLADVGSGAGFPGIPIKLWAPQIELTLIESQNKKATFLREIVRALKLTNVEVFCGRAEQWRKTAAIVSLRAVERFERVLPQAATLVARGGRMCLLIGSSQVAAARALLGDHWHWTKPVPIPHSHERVVVIAEDTAQAE